MSWVISNSYYLITKSMSCCLYEAAQNTSVDFHDLVTIVKNKIIYCKMFLDPTFSVSKYRLFKNRASEGDAKIVYCTWNCRLNMCSSFIFFCFRLNSLINSDGARFQSLSLFYVFIKEYLTVLTTSFRNSLPSFFHSILTYCETFYKLCNETCMLRYSGCL